LRKYVTAMAGSSGDLVRALAWLGLDDARSVLRDQPDTFEAWKDLGQLELFRELPAQPAPRFRAPFDPVLDLSVVRATYALRRALARNLHASSTLLALKMAYDLRLMHESALPMQERLERVMPAGPLQALEQEKGARKRADYLRELGPPPG